MALKYPNSNVAFVVGPGYFLGDFDVYDREETLGAKLDKFNPNDKSQLHLLLDEYFFNGARVASLSPEHKAELIRVLEAALNNEEFDFSALVTHERDPEDYFTLPDSWSIKDPRSMFINIYNITLEHWRNDLQVAGVNPSPF